jgi:hypothetical protein
VKETNKGLISWVEFKNEVALLRKKSLKQKKVRLRGNTQPHPSKQALPSKFTYSEKFVFINLYLSFSRLCFALRAALCLALRTFIKFQFFLAEKAITIVINVLNLTTFRFGNKLLDKYRSMSLPVVPHPPRRG